MAAELSLSTALMGADAVGAAPKTLSVAESGMTVDTPAGIGVEYSCISHKPLYNLQNGKAYSLGPGDFA